MRYNIFSVMDLIEVMYVIGFEKVNIHDFIFHFCKKFQLEPQQEQDRIKHMLQSLEKQHKIELINDEIIVFNPLTKGLRLVINDMEV